MPFNFFRRRKEAHDAEATAVAEAESDLDEALVQGFRWWVVRPK